MVLKHKAAQRREYLNMIDRVGREWLHVFEDDTQFYSAVYWDLLTNIWRQDAPVRKTDAARFLSSIKSAHTAGKYIETALRKGFLVETDNPEDARSKLIMLSPEFRARLDAFFDAAVGEVMQANEAIQSHQDLGDSP